MLTCALNRTEGGAYKAWFVNVAEAIRSGDRESLLVTPEEAAYTIHIIETALQVSFVILRGHDL